MFSFSFFTSVFVFFFFFYSLQKVLWLQAFQSSLPFGRVDWLLGFSSDCRAYSSDRQDHNCVWFEWRRSFDSQWRWASCKIDAKSSQEIEPYNARHLGSTVSGMEVCFWVLKLIGDRHVTPCRAAWILKVMMDKMSCALVSQVSFGFSSSLQSWFSSLLDWCSSRNAPNTASSSAQGGKEKFLKLFCFFF